MLQFEEENRADIAQHFDIHFRNCQAMVNFANRATDALIRHRNNNGLCPASLTVLVSIIVREARKLRAAAVLCERGFVGEAEQLARSLLDGAIAARFVCRDPVPANERPAGIRDPKFPPIPTDKNPIDFRCEIYAGHMLMQKYRSISNPDIIALGLPSETIKNIESSAKQLIGSVGQQWADRIGGASGYAGIGVKDLAGNYELLELYRLYKDLSNQTHANDAFAGVQWDDEGSISVMWCGKEEQHIPDILKLGASFLADTCRTILHANGLPGLGDEAYSLAQALNQIP